MILLANMFLSPNHTFVDLDRHLCAKSIDLFDETIKSTDDKAFAAVRRIVRQLARKAEKAAIPNSTLDLQETSSSNVFATDLTVDSATPNWDFDPLEEEMWLPSHDFSLNEFERLF